MGLYATVTAPVECPTCHATIHAGWQFYFGDVAQPPCYVVGETIRWGTNNRGEASMRDVIAVGYCDTAPFCGNCGHQDALADVRIVDDVIRSVTFRSLESWIAPTLFVGPDRSPY